MAASDSHGSSSRREFVSVSIAAAVASFAMPVRRVFASPLATPPEVLIAQFTDRGRNLGVSRVQKVVKSEAEWHKQLSAEAFGVARLGGTEYPFTGAYWNLHEQGIFRCICCDTALFSSKHKFDSGTGWPSFWQPIAPENVGGRDGTKAGPTNTEVTCQRCDAHLGDLFDDGPRPTGQRYCIDSVAMRFVRPG